MNLNPDTKRIRPQENFESSSAARRLKFFRIQNARSGFFNPENCPLSCSAEYRLLYSASTMDVF
jgi:hypothetical protein